MGGDAETLSTPRSQRHLFSQDLCQDPEETWHGRDGGWLTWALTGGHRRFEQGQRQGEKRAGVARLSTVRPTAELSMWAFGHDMRPTANTQTLLTDAERQQKAGGAPIGGGWAPRGSGFLFNPGEPGSETAMFKVAAVGALPTRAERPKTVESQSSHAPERKPALSCRRIPGPAPSSPNTQDGLLHCRPDQEAYQGLCAGVERSRWGRASRRRQASIRSTPCRPTPYLFPRERRGYLTLGVMNTGQWA